MRNTKKTNDKSAVADDSKKNELPGYPLYPAEDDIYNKAEKIHSPRIDHTLENTGKRQEWNEKSFEEDVSGDDLDVPGSELDDEQEAIGNEDEENNYYSLGGDNHIDLEENDGEQ